MPSNHDVWVVWPGATAKKSNENIPRWRNMGYKIAVLINPPMKPEEIQADLVIQQKEWKGFPVAMNLLCRAVPGPVVVCVGDDVWPDPTYSAQQIAEQFERAFPNLYGVMQPTGDQFGAYNIAAIAPWIGRAFIDKSYGGQGPFCETYYHYWSDAELQEAAILQDAFEQRPDLVQFHDHWQRKGQRRPTYLEKPQKEHDKDKRRFKRRKALGFPMSQRRTFPGLADHVSYWCEQYEAGPQEGHETPNGYGSWLENTKEIREALPVLFSKYKIRKFTDIPCGDWNWMRRVDLRGIDYQGYDVVPQQVQANRLKFSGPGHKFSVGNLVTDPIRRSDMVLVRDLLFHLPNDWALAALQTVKSSCSRWLLSTTFPHAKQNRDISRTGGIHWRKINLELPPFNLPKPVEVIQENSGHACEGRVVALFDMEDWHGY